MRYHSVLPRAAPPPHSGVERVRWYSQATQAADTSLVLILNTDTVLGIQYAFNCVALTVAMAAADLVDEKKVTALQSTGALPDAKGDAREARATDIENAAKVPGKVDLEDARLGRGCGSLVKIFLLLTLPLISGGLITLLVSLRGRTAFVRSENGDGVVESGENLVTGLVLLVNIISFDIIRFQVTWGGSGMTYLPPRTHTNGCTCPFRP